MVKITSVKKFLFLLVALLLCATVVFAACDNGNFVPLKDKPSGQTPEGNGGIAVVYGDWLYYINGYTSDSSVDNTYSNDVVNTPRIGSVVRIKLASLEALFELSEAELDDDDEYDTVTAKVAAAVRGDIEGIDGAETVVPRIYISDNSSETRITGLYIFDDRIYITTPNDQLTAGGNTRTDELVLMSYDLNGANETRHFNFGVKNAQIWMGKVDGKVVATFVKESKLYHLDVATGEDTLIELNDADEYELEKINDVSGENWDLSDDGQCIFFINAVGEICKLPLGSKEYEVVVENEIKNVGDESIETTYKHSIKGVNNGQVYYTKAEEDGVDSNGSVLYWIDSTASEPEAQVALNSSSHSDAIAWKDGMVVYADNSPSGSYHGLKITWGKASENEKKVVLPYEDYEETISVSRIVGDTLYYTVEGVSYTLNLQKAYDLAPDFEGDREEELQIVAYAANPSTTGWAAPDYVNVQTDDGVIHYVITMASSSVTVVKFDPEEKKNSEKSVVLTLKAA